MRRALVGESAAYMDRLNALTDQAARPWFDHPGFGGDIRPAGADRPGFNTRYGREDGRGRPRNDAGPPCPASRWFRSPGRPSTCPMRRSSWPRRFAMLDAMEVELVGPRALLFDADAVREALPALTAEAPDLLMILQVHLHRRHHDRRAGRGVWTHRSCSGPSRSRGPAVGWRLNSLCGVNLGAHALGRNGRPVHWVHRAPDDSMAPLESAWCSAAWVGEETDDPGPSAFPPAEAPDRQVAERARDPTGPRDARRRGPAPRRVLTPSCG